MERLLGMPVRAADSRAAQMDVYDLTTTVRGGSGHENAGAIEPKPTIRTSVLFGTLLGPAVLVTAQDSDGSVAPSCAGGSL